MSSALAARLGELEAQKEINKAKAKERTRFAAECSLNCVAQSDAAYYWLPKLVVAQQHESDSVVVNNKGEAGWGFKNMNHLYAKALQHFLGENYEVRVRFSRWFMRSYIEVSWAPSTGGE